MDATAASPHPTAETKTEIQVAYNGISREIEVQPESRVQALLKRVIELFGISGQPHLLSLFREDGTKVEEDQSVADAGLVAGVRLFLRPDAVKGGHS